jgi:hydrogenase nickel incorporation protein HypB
MCATCGCGQSEPRVETLHREHAHHHAHEHMHTHADGTTHSHSHSREGENEHEHEHAHAHEHVHTHADGTTHSHPHNHGGEHAHAHAPQARVISIERDILARNDAVAAVNRRGLQAAKTLALNLVSSPGAGKTALLVETLQRIGSRFPVAVIEGDQETTADADRIRATGAPAVQINTGKGCHLDAELVRTALDRLGMPKHGVLFIENVGNLVCPAGFDLGEAHKVVIASVTEGEDKPLKYAGMFAAADLMVVSKVDLLPHLVFDVAKLIENARRINPKIAVLKVSAKSGEGMDRWLQWLDTARALRLAAD